MIPIMKIVSFLLRIVIGIFIVFTGIHALFFFLVYMELEIPNFFLFWFWTAYYPLYVFSWVFLLLRSFADAFQFELTFSMMLFVVVALDLVYVAIFSALNKYIKSRSTN